MQKRNISGLQLAITKNGKTIKSGFGHYESVIPHSAKGYTCFITGSFNACLQRI